MIIKQKDGSLLCNKCKRTCDDACYSSCSYYKGTCTTCTHYLDESGYCDGCDLIKSKWEDAYEH